MSMKEAGTTRSEPTRHGIHVTIQHVTGAMRAWVIVSQNKAFRFVAQLADSLQNITCRILFCSKTVFIGFCAERGGIRSAIHIPDLLGNLVEEFFQVFASFADFDEGVQKAFDQNNHRE